MFRGRREGWSQRSSPRTVVQEPGPGLAESMRSPGPGRARGRGGAVCVHVLCCVSGAGGLSRRWGRHRAKASRHASHTKKKERRSRFLERRLQTCQGLVGDQVGREVWAGDGRPYVPRSTPPGAGRAALPPLLQEWHPRQSSLSSQQGTNTDAWF